MTDIDLSQLPPESPDDSDGMKQLRAALRASEDGRKAALEQVQQDAATRKENAFLRAGVPTDTPLGQMFLDSYNGELTPEAVKLRADELGIGSQTPPPPAPAPSDADRQTIQQGLAGDQVPPGAPGDEPSGNPWDEGYKAREDRLAQGGRADNAAAEVLDRVIDAAANGDERVIFDRERWKADNGFTG